MPSKLSNIFKRHIPLSRDEIKSYGSSNDHSFQQHIEEKAMSNEFSQDALDGWEELGYDTNVMKNLDAKFGKPGLSPLAKIGIITVGVAIVFITFYLVADKKDTSTVPSIAKTENQSDETPMIFEQEEIMVSEEIDKMTIQPVDKVVSTAIIKEEFKQIKENEERTQIRIEMPPLPKHLLPTPPKPVLASNRKNGKEVYLSDLKLLDYRSYRDKPTVTTKQLELTGTPANLENEQSVASDPVWKEKAIPYYEYIDKSSEIFRRGNYKKALSRFETILETYPDDVNALFYAGICYYNFGEYDKSIDAFNKCLSNKFDNFDQEAYWYLAKSLVEKKDKIQAKKVLEKIIESNGFYKSQAEELINKL